MRQSLILLINFLSAERAETTSAKLKPKSGAGFVRTASADFTE